jgi:hypothetical protein
MSKKLTSEEPDLLKEYKQKTKNRLFLWFMRQNVIVKSIFILVGVLIILLLAYSGYFGENNKNLIRNLCPDKDSTLVKKPDPDSLLDILKKREDSIRNASKPIGLNGAARHQVIDASIIPILNFQQVKSRIFPQLTFTVNGLAGKNKEFYKKGDELTLLLTLDQPCYVLFISIDSKGLYYPLEKYSEFYNKSENVRVVKRNLDETEGFEAYYVLASHESIDSHEVDSIVGAKQSLIKDLQFKGSDDYFRLELPKGIYQDNIFFYSNYNGDK